MKASKYYDEALTEAQRSGSTKGTAASQLGNHGGIVTETAPADASGIRPQKRYSYTQLYAWMHAAT